MSSVVAVMSAVASQEITGWINILNCTNDFGGVGTTVYDFRYDDIDVMARQVTLSLFVACVCVCVRGRAGEPFGVACVLWSTSPKKGVAKGNVSTETSRT